MASLYKVRYRTAGHQMSDLYVANSADEAIADCKAGAGCLIFIIGVDFIEGAPGEDLTNEFPGGEFPYR